MLNWLRHMFGFHRWLDYGSGNYVCRDCPRMSYEGPFGDGLEDYRISVETWQERKAALAIVFSDGVMAGESWVGQSSGGGEMIKREELSSPNSCLNQAEDYEKIFVLLERDAATPYAIRCWAEQRIALGKNKPEDIQIKQALETAQAIEDAHALGEWSR